jgi:hypothetical protein
MNVEFIWDSMYEYEYASVYFLETREIFPAYGTH